MAKVITRTPEP